jgi:hypothetical protein
LATRRRLNEGGPLRAACQGEAMHNLSPGVLVTLSQEGLRRTYGDNDLHRIANKRDRHCRSIEIALIWLITIALGVLMGATAAQMAGIVS